MLKDWKCRYRLPGSTKYYYKVVQALYQHEAKKIFEAEMPSATLCGNPTPL